LDAKYYNSELSIGTVEKTLDDMVLRKSKYGIVICSEDAKTTIVDQVINLDTKLNQSPSKASNKSIRSLSGEKSDQPTLKDIRIIKLK
jgi:hypothetical protein